MESKSADGTGSRAHASLREQLPTSVTIRLADELAKWVPLPVLVVAPDGQVIRANAAARALPASALSRRPSGQPIESSGYSLVIMGDPHASSGARVARAAERWVLTTRQKEVLPLLLAGLSNKEIAGELAVSLRTVESHITEILTKANVDSRARLLHLLWTGVERESTIQR